MVLQSQQNHRGNARTNMYANGSRFPGWWLGVGAGAIVLVVAGWFYFNRETPQRAEAGQSSGEQANSGSPGNGSGEEFVGLTNQTPNNENSAGADRSTPPPAQKPDNEVMLPRGDRASNDTDTSTAIEEKQLASGGSEWVMGQQVPEQKKTTDTANPQDERQAEPFKKPVSTPTSRASDPQVAAMMQRGHQFADQNRLIDARREYNAALKIAKDAGDAEELRRLLTELNLVLVFGPAVVPGDTWTTTHTISSGDRLSAIARDHGIDFNLIADINQMKDPNVVRLGQKLKVVRGPFHALVDKSDFRIDVYLGKSLDDPDRLYVRSFPIGLGELGSTPVGEFKVRSDGKLQDPDWTNPRTGEYFKGNDPDNPIGRFWIGIEGTDEQSRLLSGYGIHGTIDPSSIGRLMSMGCVRLFDDDVEALYRMLVNSRSEVHIRE